MGISLEPEEQTAVAVLEARFSDRARYPITLDSLLTEWDHFVCEVEQGYPLDVYEYTNDLSTRDLIDELLASISKSAQKKLVKYVRPVDERFKRATLPDEGSRLSRFIRPWEGWWWQRIPEKLVGTLASDLAPDD